MGVNVDEKLSVRREGGNVLLWAGVEFCGLEWAEICWSGIGRTDISGGFVGSEYRGQGWREG